MADTPDRLPPPDVEIGGRAYVRVADGVSRRPLLLPADAELTEAAADYHYRRSSEVMARQIERGKAPWLLPRDPGTNLPENFASQPKPHRGQNAVWLQAASDHRGYSDPRWGTSASIEQAGGSVRPEERSQGITVLMWREHWQTHRPRVFAMTAFNAEQCEGLPPRDPAVTAHGLTDPPPARELLRPATLEHAPGASAHYDPARDRIVLPPAASFADEQAYLRAAIRQLGHWAGQQDRLTRAAPRLRPAIPGSPRAASEELRGEIHAMLAGCRLGIGHEPSRDPDREASQARALRDDPHAIYQAASDAEILLAYAADRARPRAPAPPAPSHGLTSAADMVRQLRDNPPWERAR